MPKAKPKKKMPSKKAPMGYKGWSKSIRGNRAIG